ncbi:MAG: helix-turn-helix transcriptional regulator [bacterium]|nr:helix-turn-helix transcriptional regulator [bacterium]
MSNYDRIEIDRLSEVFKALSNPNRLRLFLQLRSCCAPNEKLPEFGNDETYVGELAQNLDVAPSTVSHHIKELQRAGLITTNRRGKNVCCGINIEKLKELVEFFGS